MAKPTLLNLLQESYIRVQMEKLNARMAVLEAGAQAGRLGQHTIRARARYLEKDRRALAAQMRKFGYEVY